MLEEEKHILIERFFNGELSANEVEQFRTLLQTDAAFRAEVEVHQEVIKGIQATGNKMMHAELKEIQAEVKGQMRDYKPGNSGGFNLLKWLLGIAVVAGAAYGLYKSNKLPSSAKELEQKIMHYDSTVNKAQSPDTVYHTIHTSKVQQGDTVVTYNWKETQKVLDGDSSELQPKVIIKYDTIRKIMRDRSISQ
ncbi:MAG: hypothetical protein U0V74_09480 [Chitinophagales bacterium]